MHCEQLGSWEPSRHRQPAALAPASAAAPAGALPLPPAAPELASEAPPRRLASISGAAPPRNGEVRSQPAASSRKGKDAISSLKALLKSMLMVTAVSNGSAGACTDREEEDLAESRQKMIELPQKNAVYLSMTQLHARCTVPPRCPLPHGKDVKKGSTHRAERKCRSLRAASTFAGVRHPGVRNVKRKESEVPLVTNFDAEDALS